MLFSAVLFSALASFVSAQLTIATPPSLVQCQPVALTWSGGEGPYILSIIPGGQSQAEAIKFLGDNIQSSPFRWVVDVPAGTQVNVKIVDNTGAQQFTSPLTIQGGGSNACLNASASSGGATTPETTTGGTPPAETSAAPSTAASASTSAPVNGGASVAPSASKSAGAAASSTSAAKPAATSTGSGAMVNVVAIPAVAAAVAGALLF